MFDRSPTVDAKNPTPDPTTAPTLRLFNGFRLACGSARTTVSLNGQRLLAFLALRGDTIRVDSAGTLWPEVTEARANGNLRTTIWRLQRCGIRIVESQAHVLTLAPNVRVDVREFVEAAACIEQFTESYADQRQILDSGDLLPGWYEDWVLIERERLRQIRLHTLDTLAGHLTERRQYARALEVALQCVHLEPLRESAHREIIAIHLAEHNVAEALRHYEFFRQFLHNEMRIEPSPQLRNMLPETNDVPIQRAPIMLPH